MQRFSKFDKQIDEIISQMTLKEKIGQLNQVMIPHDTDELEAAKELVRRGEVGTFILADSWHAGADPQKKIVGDVLNELQEVAMKRDGVKIPLVYGRDVIHGHHTVYAVPLAMAASFNMDLIHKSYRNIAEECSAAGVHWSFAPMLDMCHDPRWGRVIEGPGEDPYLGSCIAKAVVTGFQGDDLSKPDSVAACAKHFIGYGDSEGGRDYHKAEISDYSLYNYYVPAFRSAVESGCASFMSSFNEISGDPVCGSYHYLTEVLRDNIGFEGFVVSDWNAVRQLKGQGVCETDKDCAQKAINAGNDVDMVSRCYVNYLEELVKEGKVKEETIDLSLRRFLRVKFALGLFENPYHSARDVDRTEHILDSKKMSDETMVLLKNNNNLLPLKKDANIALLGPMLYEKRAHQGSWTLDGNADNVTTIYNAITQVAPTATINCRRDYTSEMLEEITTNIYKSDVVVLLLGESEQVTGEGKSLANITISDGQKALIHKARQQGKPVVGVFCCGRPIAMDDIACDFDAIVYAWHSGDEASKSIADILFGNVCPSGRTPITFPRFVGQIPIYYNVVSSGRPVNSYYGQNPQNVYADYLGTPYYPFGYGLSYTTFNYSDITLERDSITIDELKNGDGINVSVDVTNSGDMDGKETVQLYIRDCVAAFTRPLRELKAFEKTEIKVGQTKKVTFKLDYKRLGYYNPKGEYVVESGKIEVYVGENCLTDRKVTIEIK